MRCKTLWCTIQSSSISWQHSGRLVGTGCVHFSMNLTSWSLTSRSRDAVGVSLRQCVVFGYEIH